MKNDIKGEQVQKLHIKKIFGYYWSHMKKYPFSGIFTVVFYTSGALTAHIALPFVYKGIVDTMARATNPTIAAPELLFFIMVLGVMLLFIFVFYRANDYTIAYFQSNILRDISVMAFVKLQNHSYDFFVNNFAGALVTKTKRFVNAFETIHDKLIFNILSSILKTVGAVVVLLWLAPIIGSLFLLWLVFYVALTIFLVKKKVSRDLAEAEADSQVTATFADTITNVLNVKMFAKKTAENVRFEDVANFEEKQRRIAWYFHNFINVVQGALFVMLEFSIMLLAVKAWINGSISIGTIILIQAYLISTFDSVYRLGQALGHIAKALADANEMVEIFEKPIDIKDPAHPETCRITDGEITFDNVSFAYENNEKVFQDFYLSIAPGEKIGLVGHSGAGKTTITKLLLRFSDVSGGAITIDNQDIRKMTQDDLRSQISYIPQEPLLFHRTLRENITYGNTTATDEDIIVAAKKAHAHEFISRLPHGYATLVGERGIKLSGGERQRVAIARAMLKDAPILVLDEATSSLDSVSEKHIQEALTELMKGRTTIVIAHRLSTVQKMDRILVLKDGAVAEEGQHDELTQKPNGIYQNFWQEQTNSFLT